jgi:hypothetical protein
MVSVKPLKPLNEWISCNYKTTQSLHEKCLMKTLQNHSSTRGNMPKVENQCSQTKEESTSSSSAPRKKWSIGAPRQKGSINAPRTLGRTHCVVEETHELANKGR